MDFRFLNSRKSRLGLTPKYQRNRVFDRLENRDARFYKKPGFCVQEDHELRTPTKETGFLAVLKTGMQDISKKPGFCVQEDHELRTPTQETGLFDRLENRDARYF